MRRDSVSVSHAVPACQAKSPHRRRRTQKHFLSQRPLEGAPWSTSAPPICGRASSRVFTCTSRGAATRSGAHPSKSWPALRSLHGIRVVAVADPLADRRALAARLVLGLATCLSSLELFERTDFDWRERLYDGLLTM